MSYNIMSEQTVHITNCGVTYGILGLYDLTGPDEGRGRLLGRGLSHCVIRRP